jgi:hypothetical protein
MRSFTRAKRVSSRPAGDCSGERRYSVVSHGVPRPSPSARREPRPRSARARAGSPGRDRRRSPPRDAGSGSRWRTRRPGRPPGPGGRGPPRRPPWGPRPPGPRDVGVPQGTPGSCFGDRHDLLPLGLFSFARVRPSWGVGPARLHPFSFARCTPTRPNIEDGLKLTALALWMLSKANEPRRQFP